MDGFGVKHGIDLDMNFLVDKSRLSKYIKVISKKIPLLDGVDILISNPNTKIMSFEVQKTDFGFKAIVDIKEGK